MISIRILCFQIWTQPKHIFVCLHKVHIRREIKIPCNADSKSISLLTKNIYRILLCARLGCVW